MPRARCLAYDNRDDRREMHQLLARLSPAKRLRFLAWCCARATLPNTTIQPRVGRTMPQRARLADRDDSADEKLTLEVFLDIWNLSLQYQLDLKLAAEELERWARKG